jgi:hypothetical protein
MQHITSSDARIPIRFPERLALRVPKDLPRAVELAANRVHTNPAEWTRQVILRALAAEGIDLCRGDATPGDTARHLAA